MSARRTNAASPSASSAWWRSIDRRDGFGRPQRRARTPPTSAWSTPSSRRSWWMRSSGVRASPWTCARVARVGVHEHELADVVQQRGDHQAVAVLVADLGGEAVGGALGGDARAGGSARARRPRRARARRSRRCAARLARRLDGLGREHLDGARRPISTRPRRRPSTWLARRSTAIDERDVGLDGGDHVAGRDALLGDQRAAGGCATRRAPGTPRAPRTRRSGAGRGPRCGAAGRRRPRGAGVMRSGQWQLAVAWRRHARSARDSGRAAHGGRLPVYRQPVDG